MAHINEVEVPDIFATEYNKAKNELQQAILENDRLFVEKQTDDDLVNKSSEEKEQGATQKLESAQTKVNQLETVLQAYKDQPHLVKNNNRNIKYLAFFTTTLAVAVTGIAIAATAGGAAALVIAAVLLAEAAVVTFAIGGVANEMRKDAKKAEQNAQAIQDFNSTVSEEVTVEQEVIQGVDNNQEQVNLSEDRDEVVSKIPNLEESSVESIEEADIDTTTQSKANEQRVNNGAFVKPSELVDSNFDLTEYSKKLNKILPGPDNTTNTEQKDKQETSAKVVSNEALLKAKNNTREESKNKQRKPKRIKNKQRKPKRIKNKEGKGYTGNYREIPGQLNPDKIKERPKAKDFKPNLPELEEVDSVYEKDSSITEYPKETDSTKAQAQNNDGLVAQEAQNEADNAFSEFHNPQKTNSAIRPKAFIRKVFSPKNQEKQQDKNNDKRKKGVRGKKR